MNYSHSINSMKANGISGEEAYGKMLGTSMACALLEMLLSMLPGKVLRKIFPPVVTAVTVTLIGVALVGTGMKYWGGGTVCAEMIWKEHSQVRNSNPYSISFLAYLLQLLTHNSIGLRSLTLLDSVCLLAMCQVPSALGVVKLLSLMVVLSTLD